MRVVRSPHRLEPSLALTPEFAPAPTVLIARSVDAGWVPTFALAAGVIRRLAGCRLAVSGG
jgi:hypothetical protein